MPTYQYACTTCGHQFDVAQSFTEDSLSQCPQCPDGTLRKLFGNVGVVFKGSGFYRNDSRESSRAKSPASGDAGKKDSAAGGGAAKKDSTSGEQKPSSTSSSTSGATESSSSSGGKKTSAKSGGSSSRVGAGSP